MINTKLLYCLTMERWEENVSTWLVNTPFYYLLYSCPLEANGALETEMKAGLQLWLFGGTQGWMGSSGI